MKNLFFILILAVMLASPVTGFAMKGMDHGNDSDMGKMDHGSMDMGGKMIMLDTTEVDGVKGMAHLNDVREQMTEHGMKQTHHIMIAFEDVASGEAVASGAVAVKIEDPDEKVSEAIEMMGMDGHYGVDITLDKKGMYHFKIGTKLADGKKRMFHYHFENK